MVEEGGGKFAENHQTDWSRGDLRRRGATGPKKGGSCMDWGQRQTFDKQSLQRVVFAIYFLTWSILSLLQILYPICLHVGIYFEKFCKQRDNFQRDLAQPTTSHSIFECVLKESFQKVFVDHEFFHVPIHLKQNFFLSICIL